MTRIQLKQVIEKLINDNSNQEITAQDVKDAFALVYDNSDLLPQLFPNLSDLVLQPSHLKEGDMAVVTGGADKGIYIAVKDNPAGLGDYIKAGGTAITIVDTFADLPDISKVALDDIYMVLHDDNQVVINRLVHKIDEQGFVGWSAITAHTSMIGFYFTNYAGQNAIWKMLFDL